MAVEYININTTASGGKGSELKNLVNQLENVVEHAKTLKLQLDAMVDGSDYSAIGTYFGVGTKGETVYNLFSGALTELESTNVTQFIKRLG